MSSFIYDKDLPPGLIRSAPSEHPGQRGQHLPDLNVQILEERVFEALPDQGCSRLWAESQVFVSVLLAW